MWVWEKWNRMMKAGPRLMEGHHTAGITRVTSGEKLGMPLQVVLDCFWLGLLQGQFAVVCCIATLSTQV